MNSPFIINMMFKIFEEDMKKNKKQFKKKITFVLEQDSVNIKIVNY